MPLHETIAATLYAEDRLWLPTLTEKYWAKTYSVAKIGEQVNTFSSGSVALTTSWVTAITLTACYPADWAFDTTWRTLKVRLSLPIAITNLTAAARVFEARFVTDAETTHTTAAINLNDTERGTITKTYATIPTGATDEAIEFRVTAATANGQIDRTEDTGDDVRFGPDAYMEFYEP